MVQRCSQYIQYTSYSEFRVYSGVPSAYRVPSTEYWSAEPAAKYCKYWEYEQY